MTSKIKLSQKREKWVGKRDVTLKGKPLTNNVGLEVKYQKKLQRLVDEMGKEVARETMKLFKSDTVAGFAQDDSITSAFRILINRLSRKYDKVFTEGAKSYANYLARMANKQSETMVKSSFKQLSGGLSIDVSKLSPAMRESIKAITQENVSLIKTLKSQFFDKIEGDVYRSITQSDTGGLKGLQESIQKSLQSRYAQQRNRAKNIALDQTRKAYNNLNAKRMENAGVKKFVWRHSGGGQSPREDHVEMDGKVYSLDNPPVIDKRTGERGLPGQAINCRCFMVPVIEFDNGEEADD